MHNKDSTDFGLWIDNIFEGYITEFIFDIVNKYNDAKRELFKGLRGIFLLSLQLWIMMLICKKGILNMNFDE